MQVPGSLRAATVVVVAQAAGLLAITIVLVVKTLVSAPDSVGRALLEAAMAAFGAAVLLLGARGLYRLRPSARSPVMVLELLALPVSYSLAIQAGQVGYGGPILISALAVLYLLFTPSARETLNRPG